MNVISLTRALIDVESITNNEEAVGLYLCEILAPLVSAYGGRLERMEVEPRRFNVMAQWGERLLVTLSTHMDTVPPFVASREDETHIWGRGACDAKGIIAAMIEAAENLLRAGQRDFGVLFVVGEERNSAGAAKAAESPRGSRYIINGEPTENRLALASKGALRYEVTASGKMAHSAYPELGDSAIHKLIDTLGDMLQIDLPKDALLGPSTMNIGTLPAAAPSQCDCRRSPRRHHDPPGGRLGGNQSRSLARGFGTRRIARDHRNPRPAPQCHRWHGNHGGCFHYRYSCLRGPVGRAVFDRSRHHPRGAYAGRTRRQSGVALEAAAIYERMVKELCKRELK